MTNQKKLDALLALVGKDSTPNLNALNALVSRIDSLSLSVKFFGYELAKALAEALPQRENIEPVRLSLESKACTQADLAADWVAYWCSQLKVPVIFHRKLWEIAYVLQAIQEHGYLRAGARGLGFGCGAEIVPSYLAQHEIDVTVTDLPPEAMKQKGWADTNQHTSSLEQAYHRHLVSREGFDRHVSLRYVDMNSIDSDLTGYDFCWSICAFEHLGSIKKGLNFIENSLATLRPGGLSVHTTEFNFMNDDQTIDNWPTVLFQKKHFIELSERLRAKGHTVAPLNFDVGSRPMDKFIDVPPWSHDWPDDLRKSWGGGDSYHLKVCVDGFPSTCFGLAITKGGG
jgi:2-polyprenyl-3-methyl-5-hydroxy-6-metoxy-1,4-benzoquinol methylase